MAAVSALWPYGVVLPTEVKGQPRKGYTKRLNGCWEYDGFLDRDGYGLVTINLGGRKNTSQAAHRFFWTKWVGPLDTEIQLDHKCRVRSCINPKHLRKATHAQNMAYAKPYRRHRRYCKRGHKMSEGNVYVWKGQRTCKTCHSARGYMRYRDVTYDQALRVMEKRMRELA